MEMTIVASHEGLGSGTHLDRPTYGATFQGGFFDSRDTFQGWLAIKSLISGDITKIPEKSWRNTSSCFPWGFSSSSFYTLSGPEKMKLFKTFHLFMFFFHKKGEDLCHFQSGTFRFFFRDFPHTWRIQALQPRRRWKNLTVKAPRTCCAKVWWLPTVGYPKPKPTLPGNDHSHIITYPSRGSRGENHRLKNGIPEISWAFTFHIQTTNCESTTGTDIFWPTELR